MNLYIIACRLISKSETNYVTHNKKYPIAKPLEIEIQLEELLKAEAFIYWSVLLSSLPSQFLQTTMFL